MEFFNSWVGEEDAPQPKLAKVERMVSETAGASGKTGSTAAASTMEALEGKRKKSAAKETLTSPEEAASFERVDSAASEGHTGTMSQADVEYSQKQEAKLRALEAKLASLKSSARLPTGSVKPGSEEKQRPKKLTPRRREVIWQFLQAMEYTQQKYGAMEDCWMELLIDRFGVYPGRPGLITEFHVQRWLKSATFAKLYRRIVERSVGMPRGMYTRSQYAMLLQRAALKLPPITSSSSSSEVNESYQVEEQPGQLGQGSSTDDAHNMSTSAFHPTSVQFGGMLVQLSRAAGMPIPMMLYINPAELSGMLIPSLSASGTGLEQGEQSEARNDSPFDADSDLSGAASNADHSDEPCDYSHVSVQLTE